MANVIDLFTKLGGFCDDSLFLETVIEIYKFETIAKKNGDKSGDDEINPSDYGITIRSLPLVQRAMEDSDVLSTMLELSTMIRELHQNRATVSNNWLELIKRCPRDKYLTFVYALSSLATLDSTSSICIKLSLAAANIYLLSVTIAGSRVLRIFNEVVFSQCLNVFSLLEKNEELLLEILEQECIWINFIALFADLETVFRYVHLDDYLKTRDALLMKLVSIQDLNYKHGFNNQYAEVFHNMTFGMFEMMTRAHHGVRGDTLMYLMQISKKLHIYLPETNGGSGHGGHISDFFMQCIAKYPEDMVKVLHYYIQEIIDNVVDTRDPAELHNILEYGAMYDAVLFARYNKSIVHLLFNALEVEDSNKRARAIKLMGLILLKGVNVELRLEGEVSDIPREVYILQVLIESLKENSTSVQLNAVQALYAVLTQSSSIANKILSQCLRSVLFNDNDVQLPNEPQVNENEIRFSNPDPIRPIHTFCGYQVLSPAVLNLPKYVYKYMYHNSQIKIQRIGILLVDQMVRLNPLIICNTEFLTNTISLTKDPKSSIRKKVIMLVDALMDRYPNCFYIIYLWCKIFSPMLRDNDASIVELAMDCFNNRVLLKIKSIEQNTQAKHYMPWFIVSLLHVINRYSYLQVWFQKKLPRRMVTTKLLDIVESYVPTSKTKEAWLLLSMMAGKAQSTDPDVIIDYFVTGSDLGVENNMSMAFDVIKQRMIEFSQDALNRAFNFALNTIYEDLLSPSLLVKAIRMLINICDNIPSCSNQITDDKQWCCPVNSILKKRIINNMRDVTRNTSAILSNLKSYSAVNFYTPLPVDMTIFDYIIQFLHQFIIEPESVLSAEKLSLFNIMLALLGRFSVIDSDVAKITCYIYNIALDKIESPVIVHVIIGAIETMVKKQSPGVESTIGNVLQKLTSPHAMNRLDAFKFFVQCVLEDRMELRGALLMSMLEKGLDENEEMIKHVDSFFHLHLATKNETLFLTCLIECPYVLNDYENFDGMDLFFDENINSVLKGENMRRYRHELYDFIILKMDESDMYLYFEQLDILADKFTYDEFFKSSKGVALMKDILYILRRMFEVFKIDVEDNEEESEISMSLANFRVWSFVEFINNIRNYIDITKYTPLMEQCAIVLWTRFPKILINAKPESFWEKYREAEVADNPTTSKVTKRKLQPIQATDESGFSDDDDDSKNDELIASKLLRIDNSPKDNN